MNQEINLEQIAFEIISYAGDAFSDSMEALRASRGKDFESANKSLTLANDNLTKAHQIHSQLLFNFAQGKEIKPSILLVHAQDHMTKVELMVVFVEEMINLHQSK